MSTLVEDVDIQAEKKKYVAFRRKTIFYMIGSFVAAFAWLFSWLFFVENPLKGKESSWDSAIAAFWFLLSPPGLGLVLIVGFVVWLWERLEKYHFRCPSSDCDEAIYLIDNWFCPTDRSTNRYPWTIWYTIFTRCRKHNHPSPAHKCPQCGHIFKLVENPRTGLNKFSYRPENTPQSPPQNPQNPPQPPAPRQEYIPRDGNFF